MQKLSEIYENLTGWWDLSSWLGVDPSFQQGLVTGIAGCLVLALIWLMIRLRILRRERCKGIRITGESGDMFITITAIREFVKRIVADFDETSLEGIKLKQRGNTLRLVMEVTVLPEVELVPLRDALQSRIVEEAQKSLGIERPLRVDVTVKSVEASAKKVGRKNPRRQHHNEVGESSSMEDMDEQ